MYKNFYPIITEDKSVSLFNTDINDVYHSKVGASKEAYYKFIVPSGILEFVKSNDEVTILDVCYGLGYNTKKVIDEIIKVNSKCKINITCLEIDPAVVALSNLIDSQIDNEQINKIFLKALIKDFDVKRYLVHFAKDINFTPYIEQKNKLFLNQVLKSRKVIYKKHSKYALFHNIYYRTVSISNKKYKIIHHTEDFLNIDFYLGDARKSILDINKHFDFIFHDPFTPAKVPCLWSVEFFDKLYGLLKENGNLTTYSTSAAVRSGLIEAGFNIGRTEPVGRKTSGTIAYKKVSLVKDELSEKELGLIQTKAGIPYRDPELHFSNEQILNYRGEEMKVSDRQSSSSFLKVSK